MGSQKLCGFVFVLAAFAAPACERRHGFGVSDAGKGDHGTDSYAAADLLVDAVVGADIPTGTDLFRDTIAQRTDSGSDRADRPFPDERVDASAADLPVPDGGDSFRDVGASWDAPVAPEVAGDAGGPDRPSGAPDLAGSQEAGTPVPATPSGGCVPAVVTPSLAFYGVVGIDFDEDGIADDVDNCPAEPGADQRDSDGDGLGDLCDRCPAGPDGDQDGVCDDVDNCPTDWNPSQYDTDGNRIGDRCDGQRCFFWNGTEQIQRDLHALLGKPDFAAALADAHWRVLSTDNFCRSNALATQLVIVDYRHRKQVAVTLLTDSNEVVSFQVAALTDLQGPQPSAEEGREAMYMAEHDPQVRPVLDSLANLISAGAFFYEFGSHPATNDPAFPSCATGRCIDVLYSGRPPDGGYADYSVVVDMDACRVLGIRLRP